MADHRSGMLALLLVAARGAIANATCVDTPAWTDSGGDGCAWYGAAQSFCWFADFFQVGGVSATDACCACGGGSESGAAPAAPAPTPGDGAGVAPVPQGQCGAKGPEEPGSGWRRLRGSGGTRIVNGQEAGGCEWPWQVALVSWYFGTGEAAFCGGTLISERWVLTAAHCVDGSAITAVLGRHSSGDVDSEEDAIAVSRQIPHPLYDPNSMDYDYALLELERPATLGQCVDIACLPTGEVDDGASCMITGWGTLETNGVQPDKLQEAHVSVVSNSQCNAMYSGEVTDQMICAQGSSSDGITDACQGDSGGPLVCETSPGKWTLYGVTSWGYGCADPDYPGIWARVHSIMSWIESTAAVTAEAPASTPQPEPTPAPEPTPLAAEPTAPTPAPTLAPTPAPPPAPPTFLAQEQSLASCFMAPGGVDAAADCQRVEYGQGYSYYKMRPREDSPPEWVLTFDADVDTMHATKGWLLTFESRKLMRGRRLLQLSLLGSHSWALVVAGGKASLYVDGGSEPVEQTSLPGSAVLPASGGCTLLVGATASRRCKQISTKAKAKLVVSNMVLWDVEGRRLLGLL